MKIRFSPEYWVNLFLKSATNGRKVSVRLRRILTIVAIPIWFVGLVYSLYWFYYGFIDANDYWFGTFYDRYFIVYEELILSLFAPIIYLLVCFIIPWIVVRLTFWVKDADKVDE